MRFFFVCPAKNRLPSPFFDRQNPPSVEEDLIFLPSDGTSGRFLTRGFSDVFLSDLFFYSCRASGILVRTPPPRRQSVGRADEKFHPRYPVPSLHDHKARPPSVIIVVFFSL